MIKQKQNNPTVSVIIPTYNSSDTLLKVLSSIKKQSYPQGKIETIVVDGGSSDNTLAIAKRFKCKVFNNPKTLQMFAMQIGREKAKGKYIIHLDSDEVIVNNKSFENKMKLFLKNKNVKAVIPSGILTPEKSSSANYFINEFGEPFSYFIYRISINARYFIGMLKRTARIIYEDKDGVLLDFSESAILPPIELAAIGIMIDRKYLLDTFPNLLKNPSQVPLSFFYMVEKGVLFGFTKNDPILHYSVSGWSKYLKKIKSRIVNNVFGLEMGKSGFTGRGKHYPKLFLVKKYLFIPYSFTFIGPIIDGIVLTLTRKKIAFLLYPLICIYISLLTIYYYVVKIMGISLVQKGYGT